MTDIPDASIDDAIDQIDDDALTASCSRIPSDGNGTSGAPAIMADNEPHRLHPRVKDLTGQVFGRLTVVAFAGRFLRGAQLRSFWSCSCSCGRTTVVEGWSLRNGTQSCGCLNRVSLLKALTRHGQARHGQESKLYKAWCHLKSRCLNPNDAKFPDYGGRGIVVCDRWLHGDGVKTGFECFAADMSPHPGKGWSIDRKDNDGPYSTDNCRWATAAEQGRNTRRNRFYVIRGEKRCLIDWARQYSLPYKTLHKRVESGWPIERALETKVRPTKMAS